MLFDSTNVIFIFETILAALLVSLLAARISLAFARKTGLIDLPGSAPHKQHGNPVPLSGGLTLLVTILVIGWYLSSFDQPDIRGAILAAVPVFIFGLWDDYRSLPPSIKLIAQVFGAVILISQGIYIQIFESPEFFFHGSGGIYLYLNWALTVLWVVGITNAFNFVDSMDGLAVGLAAMAASFFLLVTLASGQLHLALYSAMLIGVCIGLYFFNSPPALLFLGDSGAQLLGFLLAVLGISYAPLGANQSSSWFVPVMLLWVPIFDAALVIISRLRRGKPVYKSALDHCYHRLLRLGFPSSRAVLVMQVVSLTLSCLAFVSLNQPPSIANLIFLIVVLTGGLTLAILDRRTFWV